MKRIFQKRNCHQIRIGLYQKDSSEKYHLNRRILDTKPTAEQHTNTALVWPRLKYVIPA